MLISKFGGVEARMPTLDELAMMTAREGDYEAMRKLSAACVPKYAEIRKRFPACSVTLAAEILMGCGSGAPLTLIEEDEIEGEAMAKAYLEAQKKLQIVEERGGPPCILYALTVAVGDETFAFVLRGLNERETDDYMKSEGPHQAKALHKKVRVYSSRDDIDEKAPGLYMNLARFLLDRAGLLDGELVGKA
jgi:hypothetical protein